MDKKKSKKTSNKKKDRTAYTYFTSKEKISEVNIKFDPVTQSFSTDIPITNSYHEVTYDREGKSPKSINRVQFDSERFYLGSNDSLRTFDLVVAIDTNDRDVQGFKVSCTGVVVLEWRSDPVSTSHAYSYSTPLCIEFVSLEAPREIIGWCVALTELNRQGFLGEGIKVAVVVDSYLGDIPQINSRAIPLYGEFFLPLGMTLVYASADVGSEFIANQLIRHADKAATITLDYLDAGRAPFNQEIIEGKPWERVRFITGKQ